MTQMIVNDWPFIFTPKEQRPRTSPATRTPTPSRVTRRTVDEYFRRDGKLKSRHMTETIIDWK